MMIKIGNGYDIHALVPERPLILAGVTIPHEKGLLGHSDADVLLHAITDACLGALALGDIGYHFPDTDERYKNADSRQLLRHCMDLIANKKYRVSNIDSVIIAERPKLLNYILPMRKNIAEDLSIDLDCVSVKATTHEKLGALGQEEGIAAMSVVILEKMD